MQISFIYISIDNNTLNKRKTKKKLISHEKNENQIQLSIQ